VSHNISYNQELLVLCLKPQPDTHQLSETPYLVYSELSSNSGGHHLHLPADDMTITQKLNTTTKPHQMLPECHILKYSFYDNDNDNLLRKRRDLHVPKPV
jgi:hypothetical protein